MIELTLKPQKTSIAIKRINQKQTEVFENLRKVYFL